MLYAKHPYKTVGYTGPDWGRPAQDEVPPENVKNRRPRRFGAIFLLV